MDLLRLTLARQHLLKLFYLPLLLEKPAFYQLRAWLVNGTDKKFPDVGAYYFFTAPGECMSGSRRNRANRAAFLRNPVLFQRAASVQHLDFWYCVSVDEPEIVERCVELVRESYLLLRGWNTIDPDNLSTGTLHALHKLTPEIQKWKLFEYSSEQISNSLQLGQDDHNIVEDVRRNLGGTPTFEKNEAAESLLRSGGRTFLNSNASVLNSLQTLIESGYLYPLLSVLRDRSDGDNSERIATAGFYYCSYELLLFMARRGFKFADRPITDGKPTVLIHRKVVERVNRILGSQEIQQMLTREMVDIYLVIAGYVIDRPVPYFVRFSVFNGGPSTMPGQRGKSASSLQSLVLYNPEGMYLVPYDESGQELRYWELFRLGRIHD